MVYKVCSSESGFSLTLITKVIISDFKFLEFFIGY